MDKLLFKIIRLRGACFAIALMMVTCAFAQGEIYSGSVTLPPFTAGADGIWRTKAPNGFRFEQAFINGRIATRACEPDEGFFYMTEQASEKEDLRKEAFICPVAGITTNSYVRIWKAWVQGIYRIAKIDPVTKAVRIEPKGDKSHGNMFSLGNRALPYRVENYREALDSPGEWFVEGGELLYIPKAGDDIATTRVEVPTTNCLLRIEGQSNLTFKNCRFTACGLDTSHGIAGTQAQPQPISTAAVRLYGATNIVFDSCRFDCLAGTAVRVDDLCRNIVFRDCLVEEFGVGGIYIGGTRKVELEPDGVVVDNCLIRCGGRILNGGIGVWIGHARNVTVTHNEICDLYYTGISSGWTWGYYPTPVSGIKINYNYIYDIGQYALSDMAGIYTLGDHAGSEVIGNRIHDVWSNDTSGRGGWGLYADEGSTNIRYESNLVYRTKTGSIHQHYGKNVRWCNNVFAYAQSYPIEHTRVEPHHSFDFINNIVLWTNDTQGIRLARPIAGGPKTNVHDVTFSRNLYWGPRETLATSFHKMSFDEWQRLGMDEGSVIADPQLEDPANNKWMPKAGSPAYQLGFRPFDPMLAGLRRGKGSEAWANCEKRARPKVVMPRDPPYWGVKSSFNYDFEGFPSEKLPTSLIASLALGPSKQGALRITDKVAFAGTHSLEFRDAADIKHAFQPHTAMSVAMPSDDATFSFAAMTDGKANFSFLLRDYRVKGKDFANGPSVAIVKDAIWSGSQRIGKIVPNKWFKLVMTLKRVNGRIEYAIAIDSLDGSTPLKSGTLKVKNLDFINPTWCGFISDATWDTVTYIDDFNLSQH